ncbi:MAG: WD40/YVTN/BNR-like repeat-containing protein, partial [Longimicrobiales bacterium]
DRFPYWVYAGQQDNSTIGVPSKPPTSSGPDHRAARWIQIGGCETGPAVPKPTEWQTVFANCKGRFGVYSHVSGQEKQYYVGGQYMYGHDPADLIYRFQRVSPIHVSPHDPSVVYHASQYLHRTTNGGQTWETISPDLTANESEHQVISGTPITRDVTGEEFFSTIYAVEESPLERGVIWVGSNDGLVHVTRDGGESWTDVTPDGLPEDGRIQTVEASPHDPAEAYVAAYGYLLDDWRPYIYRTTDYGRTWTLLTDGTNGIPADHPTRVIREDPTREGLLFAGTSFGMFISFDEGADWQPFQRNLPVTPVTDIEITRNDLVLSTMGRGFWIMDDIGPLRQLTPRIAAAGAHLFAPDVAHRMRYRSSSRDPADPEYPEPGAIVDYWIGDDGEEAARLEILDAGGAVIRAFSSDASGEVGATDQQMRGPVTVSSGTPRLETGRGLHRFTWNLTLPGPWDEDADDSGEDGPLVTPGEYSVRLRVGEESLSQPLTVLADPRVLETGVTQEDMEAQLALNLRIRDAIGQARRLAARLEAASEGAADDRLRELLGQLVARDITYPQPMLIDQLEYLYGMTTAADQRPGDDAYVRFEALDGQLRRLAAEVDRVLPTVSQP